MRHSLFGRVGAAILLVHAVSGCEKLGISKQTPLSDGAPPEQELLKIDYMSSADSGTPPRKLYTHVEEARTCGDFELAMRWNRPPNVEGGPFHRKLIYLSSGIPADLPERSEVFITATVEDGETLPSGSARWYLRMQDGTRVQAIETESFLQKQEQTAQDGKWVALVQPNKPQRILCAQGIYEGLIGKDPEQDKKIPLVSVLFAMDRPQAVAAKARKAHR
jgi:hypothetical protein